MGLMLVVLTAALAVALAESKSYHGCTVYRVVPNEQQLDELLMYHSHPGFDFWSSSRVPLKPWDIMACLDYQHELRGLLQKGNYMYETLIEDLGLYFDQERLVQSRIGLPDNNYHSHDAINQYLESLASKYPDIASIHKAGKSTEGRELKMIIISSKGGGGGGGQRPIILIDAGIHAREWLAPAAATHVIEQLVENGTNRALVEKVDWHILPLLNPDGYEFSHTEDRMWRKTRSRTKNPLCFGVDGNRNYAYKWMVDGASDKPCHETYAGPRAFSEPETRALRDHALKFKNRIRLYLSLHSYGGFILYPWGYLNGRPKDWPLIESVGKKAAAAIKAAGGTPYAVGNSATLLGIGAGGSDDWMRAGAGIQLTYTIELPGGGKNGFDMPPESIHETVVPFFEGIRSFANHVMDTYAS